MAIQFECPHCKAGYEVADDLAGKMIMCRLCQKRGSVRSLAAAKPAPAAATPSNPSRRKFVLLAVGATGAIGGGILLARWGDLRRLWSSPAKRSPEDTTRRRGRRGGGSGRGGPNRKGPPPEQK